MTEQVMKLRDDHQQTIQPISEKFGARIVYDTKDLDRMMQGRARVIHDNHAVSTKIYEVVKGHDMKRVSEWKARNAAAERLVHETFWKRDWNAILLSIYKNCRKEY